MKAKPSSRSGEVVLELDRKDERLMAAAASVKSPFRIKNILVPTDFSDCAKKALQYAVPFAEEHQAAITLLYVVAPPTYVGGEFGRADVGFEGEMIGTGQKQLERVRVEEVHGRVPTTTVVRSGPAANEIVEAAKDLAVDLIVISTHGRTGLAHVFLGSVAEHVVRRAPCPVLVVREQEHEFIGG